VLANYAVGGLARRRFAFMGSGQAGRQRFTPSDSASTAALSVALDSKRVGDMVMWQGMRAQPRALSDIGVVGHSSRRRHSRFMGSGQAGRQRFTPSDSAFTGALSVALDSVRVSGTVVKLGGIGGTALCSRP